MYHLKINKTSFISMSIMTLLWVTIFGLSAFGAEVPSGGMAIDGTIQNVKASEISKDTGMIHASSAPGESYISADMPVSGGPVSSQPPQKTEGPQDVDTIGISHNSPSASIGSPVVTCGNGKAAPSPIKEVTNKNQINKGASLGMFTTTGYCACDECSGGFGLTYSGTVPQANHTVSADISLFPIGTRLIIGDIVYTVEDIGSNVIGEHIDIYYDNHEEAMNHGKQLQEVFTVQ